MVKVLWCTGLAISNWHSLSHPKKIVWSCDWKFQISHNFVAQENFYKFLILMWILKTFSVILTCFYGIFYTKMLGNCVFTPSQARTKAQYKVNSKGTSVLSRYSSNIDSSISGNWRCSGSTKIRKKKETFREGGYKYCLYSKKA